MARMSSGLCFRVSFTIFLLFLTGLDAYDTEDFEIFDLVEEINQNFYELFEVGQDASSSEIKRSYRRLAIQYHPDKNKEEGAEEKFRQIAAVYEVLKDEDKRQKYDVVLQTGLPDWRQPVFYYRRVRKLGLLELTAILLIILTVGHFLVLWASYFEKKFEIEEVFRSRQKKDKKGRGRNKLQAQEAKEAELTEQLNEHLDGLHKPRLLDLVPFRLVAWLWALCVMLVHTPGNLKRWHQERKAAERLEQETREAEEREQREYEKQQEAQKLRRKKVVDLAELRGEMMAGGGRHSPVIYGMSTEGSTDEGDEELTEENVEILQAYAAKEPTAWTDEEMNKLAKAVAKFPGGTAKRWHKISIMVGRPVKEVIAMSKNLKQEVTRTVAASAQGITGVTERKLIEDNVMTYADWSNGNYGDKQADLTPDGAVISAGMAAVRRRRQNRHNLSQRETLSSETVTDTNNKYFNVLSEEDKCNKKNSENLKSHDSKPTEEPKQEPENSSTQQAVAGWTQSQQKLLEQCLVSIPKGTSERWEKISREIPGKTKEDCINRYKYLAEVVKKRKAQQQATSS